MLTKGGYIIHKSKLNNNEITKLKSTLTVSPETQNNNCGFANVDSFAVFRESETRFRVPRHFGISEFGLPSINKMPNGVPISIEFKGKLKTETHQDVASAKAIEHLNKFGGGILSLPTGYGKTCVSLYILAKLSVKT